MEEKTIDFDFNISEIHAIAKKVLHELSSKTVLFYGNMGAGKTTFIKALLSVMGSTDITTSPTYSIVNEYRVDLEYVYHFDFYRIENTDEAYDFGIEDYLHSNNWLFIEWPERLLSVLPTDADRIDITFVDSTTRNLKLTINTANNHTKSL